MERDRLKSFYDSLFNMTLLCRLDNSAIIDSSFNFFGVYFEMKTKIPFIIVENLRPSIQVLVRLYFFFIYLFIFFIFFLFFFVMTTGPLSLLKS